jgi:uncharacterized protein
MGLEFFQKVVATQRLYAKGKAYSNALQTHEMLLNEAWADFLLSEIFLVGISLNNPTHVYDRYRKDR